MSYPTLPTFADGDYLTAAQLNLLVDAASYLTALGTAPNPGVIEQTTTSTSTYADLHYLMRYTARYLHVVTNAQDHGKLKVTIDGNIVLNITTLTDGYYDNVADLNALGLTANGWYDVLVQFTTASGTNRVCWVGFTGSATALI